MINLFLLFVILPFIELTLILRMGSVLGFFPMLFLILFTGALGAYYSKQQGQKVWNQVLNDMQRGLMPADELVNGLLIFIGGLLLITPGFITDLFGLMLVLPTTRAIFKVKIKKVFSEKIKNGSVKFYSQSAYKTWHSDRTSDPTGNAREVEVIDIKKATDFEIEKKDN